MILKIETLDCVNNECMFLIGATHQSYVEYV